MAVWTPATVASVPVPIVDKPSLNVTVPVGVPLLAPTVAVKVTDWPNVEGLSELLIEVVLELLGSRTSSMRASTSSGYP